MPALDLERIQRNVSLKPYTTLHAGGKAESFFVARTTDDLANVSMISQNEDWPLTVFGSGSNILPSDSGIHNLVVINRADTITDIGKGKLEADCGAGLQNLFLKSAQLGLTGLEFAVGIPGTVGGALVSNAGAYRSNISALLTEIEIVFEGERRWVKPEFFQFSYRDSILRRKSPPACALLKIRIALQPGNQKAIYDEAREFQRQRISKQPPPASAGSFFKNVESLELARQIPNLPEKIAAAGVVPAGYLIEHAGLVGTRHGGAMVARKHANFLTNIGDASATEIRQLAGLVRRRVHERFGILLEEEVLYIGDWSQFHEVWEN